MKMVVRNVLLNTAGTATIILAGFFVFPFLTRNLGETKYGFWALIASITASYFTVLDLGLSGSVGRQIALRRAQSDIDGVNAVMSTAWAILWGVFLLAAAAIPLVIAFFFQLFHVPEEYAADVRGAITLIGLQLALSFPGSVFSGLLWGYERFDVQNYVDIPMIVIRTACTFLLVDQGSTLTLLAWIVFGVTLAATVAKAVLCFVLEPRLRLQRKYIRRVEAREMFSFGVWFFLLNFFRNLTPQIGPMVIGNRLSAASVTTYNVAKQLTTYTNTFMVTGTQVLAPHATALHAQEDRQRQQALFLEGGRFSLAFALFFVGAFWFLGAALVDLWMQGRQNAAVPLLLVLIVGEILPMSQWITYSNILAMGRHPLLAIYAMIEAGATLALAYLLAPTWGLWGVCIAVVVPGTLLRGLGQWLLGCRLLAISHGHYTLRVFVPISLAAAGPFLALWLLTLWRTPATWIELFLFGGVYALLYGGVMASVFYRSLQRRFAKPKIAVEILESTRSRDFLLPTKLEE
jgi:O-antigen/teichoic acid export membrane protein